MKKIKRKHIKRLLKQWPDKALHWRNNVCVSEPWVGVLRNVRDNRFAAPWTRPLGEFVWHNYPFDENSGKVISGLLDSGWETAR